MENLMNVNLAWQGEEVMSVEEARLEEIRRVSNIVQALENVAAQCDDSGNFDRLERSVSEMLMWTRSKLRQLIHQPL